MGRRETGRAFSLGLRLVRTILRVAANTRPSGVAPASSRTEAIEGELPGRYLGNFAALVCVTRHRVPALSVHALPRTGAAAVIAAWTPGGRSPPRRVTVETSCVPGMPSRLWKTPDP